MLPQATVSGREGASAPADVTVLPAGAAEARRRGGQRRGGGPQAGPDVAVVDIASPRPVVGGVTCATETTAVVRRHQFEALVHNRLISSSQSLDVQIPPPPL